MFEGIVNLQLPFMLISSGVSSVLYLIFLFINIGYPKSEEIAQDEHQIILEEESNISDSEHDNSQIDILDYLSDKKTQTSESLQVEDCFSLRLLTTIRHCNLKHTYSCLFAGASYSRPPPQA